jgi:hypothetical protein
MDDAPAHENDVMGAPRIGGSQMTYFDELAKGSDAHKAERRGNTLRIFPFDETSPAGFVAFQPVYHEAREQAAAMGATHVIWTSVAGGYSPYATGKAYICK